MLIQEEKVQDTVHERITAQRDLRGTGKDFPKTKGNSAFFFFYKIELHC